MTEEQLREALRRVKDSTILWMVDAMSREDEYIENVGDGYRFLYTLQFVVSRGDNGELQSGYLREAVERVLKSGVGDLTIKQGDRVCVTGRVGDRHFHNVTGTVATVSHDALKLWPDDDPQLTEKDKHEGKLWFYFSLLETIKIL